MKKLLSVLLTLSMLLTLLIVPISAGGTEPENGDEFTPVNLGTAENPQNTTKEGDVEYYTDANSVKYIVIRTADQFKAMSGAANYILANDIDLDGATASGNDSYIIPAGWQGVLDGNGKTVSDFAIKGNNAGMFSFTDSTAIVTIKNITFGSESAKIEGVPTGNGSNGIISGKTIVKILTLENCISYVTFSVGTGGAKAAVSAFVGQANSANATYNFSKCKAYGTIAAANKLGAFLANVNVNDVTINFTDCENHVDITTGTNGGVAGFVGAVPKARVDITFTRCTNAGNLTITDGSDRILGGFVGNAANGSFGTCTFINCSNTGTLAALTQGKVGSYVGSVSASSDVVITTDDANFDYNGVIGSHPYGTKTTRGNVYFSNTINGLQTLAAAKAAYFQTAAGSAEGLQNVRILLALPESEIANIKNIEFKVVFKNLNVNEGATTKTLTVTDADAAIASYYSVIADTKIAEAPEGYVMVAVVVTDVDTSVWTASGANLEVYMTSEGGTNTIYNNTPEAEDKNP